MNKLILFTTIAILGCTTSLLAQSQEDKSQSQLNIDSYEDYKKVDKELNTLYGKVMNSMEAPQKALLKTAQKAWITFRDTDCKCIGSIYDGGSMQPLIINECMTNRTQTRIKELKEMLEN